MAAVVVQQDSLSVRVPQWVADLDSFRRWARCDDFPTQGSFAYLAGELWVDPSTERLVHNLIKTQFAVVLSELAANRGTFVSDRMRLTNTEADLSTEPDGMYLSNESLSSGRVQLADGEHSVEVEGSPDMVLEVVSPSSRQKDITVLRQLYHRAGIGEYWLVQQVKQEPTLSILLLGETGYHPSPQSDGWVVSRLFGVEFRLVRSASTGAIARFQLQVRAGAT